MADCTPSKIVALKKFHEYRIECSSPLKITLLEGTCEHLGAELLKNKEYFFEPIFFFSFHGCKLKIEGTDFFGYESADTNIPEILEFLHNRGEFSIIGSGKTTFLQIIMNYGKRMGLKIRITELDPSTGFITVPTFLGTTFNEDIKHVTSVDVNSMSFFYGTEILSNRDLHTKIKNRLLNINKPYDLHIIIPAEEVTENCIIVNDEKLFYKTEAKKKIFIRKSSGYQKSNREMKTNKKIHDYFHGQVDSFPITKQIQLYRIGEPFQTPTSALPIGKMTRLKTTTMAPVLPEKNHLCAVAYGNKNDIQNIKYFVLISEVEPLKILAPRKQISKEEIILMSDLLCN